MKVSEAINSVYWDGTGFYYVHHERNRLLSLLSAIFPASLEKHQPENEALEDWPWLVIIDLPGGQVSWHIEERELPLFDHLPRLDGRVWDGAEDQEKYQRVEMSRKMIIKQGLQK